MEEVNTRVTMRGRKPKGNRKEARWVHTATKGRQHKTIGKEEKLIGKNQTQKTNKNLYDGDISNK
jgi:hypothetical protein